MAIGTRFTKVQSLVNKAWQSLNNKLNNGTLFVAVPVKTNNINNPLAAAETSFVEYTFYGICGTRPEYNADGTLVASSVSSQKIDFEMTAEDLGAISFDDFRKLLKTSDVVIKLNGEPVTLFYAQYDSLANCVVVTFSRIQGPT